jgi:hypothetical protein
MALVSMKNPKPKKEAKKSMHEECVPSMHYEKYPYGLEIDLHEDQIKKLGIDIEECSVGDMGAVHAQIEIKSVRQSEQMNDRTGKMDTSQNLEFQITDMQFEKGVTKAEHESQGLTKRAAKNNPKKSY